MTVLTLAAVLEPDPRGVGTHTALGLQRCQFLYQTGVPCPSCGLTTSFSYLAHGQVLASAWVQPLGTVLAILTAAAVWVWLYIAITGKPALRLLRLIRPAYYLVPLLALALAAWGWKIFIHTHGLDGWR
ncbi:DUF2752 domain-containing protein [Fontivita pretiosa]|uniref:DUF2752 domain-containing protein n=1 Tax=Fontivita pretiosa TaxID=2989684 RepID=UPI003D17AB2C